MGDIRNVRPVPDQLKDLFPETKPIIITQLFTEIVKKINQEGWPMSLVSIGKSPFHIEDDSHYFAVSYSGIKAYVRVLKK